MCLFVHLLIYLYVEVYFFVSFALVILLSNGFGLFKPFLLSSFIYKERHSAIFPSYAGERKA